MPTKKDLLNQLHSLQLTGLEDKLTACAVVHGLIHAFVFAIASRETNCVNELGDWHGGEAHGVGIMQIDVQHPIAKQARDSGSWKMAPYPLIDYGTAMIADNINAAKKAFPTYALPQWLKIAASGYNTGMVNAIAGAKAGDSDLHTTGKNYGRDVMTRMAIFEELIVESS